MLRTRLQVSEEEGDAERRACRGIGKRVNRGGERAVASAACHGIGKRVNRGGERAVASASVKLPETHAPGELGRLIQAGGLVAAAS
jgi:hypothetical protein